MLLPLLMFGLLPVCAVAQYLAGRSFATGRRGRAKLLLLAGASGAALFLALQVGYLTGQDFLPQVNAYASLFYVIHWTLFLCVLVALCMTLAMLSRLRERPDKPGYAAVQMQITGMYWYFLGAMALLIYTILYVTPQI